VHKLWRPQYISPEKIVSSDHFFRRLLCLILKDTGESPLKKDKKTCHWPVLEKAPTEQISMGIFSSCDCISTFQVQLKWEMTL